MKPFWLVLEGDYAETSCYVIQAESVDDVERRVWKYYSRRDKSIVAIFDTAPAVGDFETFPYDQERNHG